MVAKENEQVPFGYEPPQEVKTGTLIVYGDFTDIAVTGLAEVYRFAGLRGFDRIVLYPIHEETGRRMGLTELPPYYRRVQELEAAMEEAEPNLPAGARALLDQWEGKRKKYTPVDTALAFLTEKHRGPFFVWIPERLALKWAGYDSFKEWIRKLRLIVAPPAGGARHPVLEEYASRWEYVRPLE